MEVRVEWEREDAAGAAGRLKDHSTPATGEPPEACYIAVRMGSCQKQKLYDPRSVYSFSEMMYSGRVDVFQRLGTCDFVWAADVSEDRLCSVTTPQGDTGIRLRVNTRKKGSSGVSSNTAKRPGSASPKRPGSPQRPGSASALRRVGSNSAHARVGSKQLPPLEKKDQSRPLVAKGLDAGLRAKKYLQEHDIDGMLGGAMKELLRVKPDDAPNFVVDWIRSRYAVPAKPPATQKAEPPVAELSSAKLPYWREVKAVAENSSPRKGESPALQPPAAHSAPLPLAPLLAEWALPFMSEPPSREAVQKEVPSSSAEAVSTEPLATEVAIIEALAKYVKVLSKIPDGELRELLATLPVATHSRLADALTSISDKPSAAALLADMPAAPETLTLSEYAAASGRCSQAEVIDALASVDVPTQNKLLKGLSGFAAQPAHEALNVQGSDTDVNIAPAALEKYAAALITASESTVTAVLLGLQSATRSRLATTFASLNPQPANRRSSFRKAKRQTLTSSEDASVSIASALLANEKLPLSENAAVAAMVLDCEASDVNATQPASQESARMSESLAWYAIALDSVSDNALLAELDALPSAARDRLIGALVSLEAEIVEAPHPAADPFAIECASQESLTLAGYAAACSNTSLIEMQAALQGLASLEQQKLSEVLASFALQPKDQALSADENRPEIPFAIECTSQESLTLAGYAAACSNTSLIELQAALQGLASFEQQKLSEVLASFALQPEDQPLSADENRPDIPFAIECTTRKSLTLADYADACSNTSLIELQAALQGVTCLEQQKLSKVLASFALQPTEQALSADEKSPDIPFAIECTSQESLTLAEYAAVCSNTSLVELQAALQGVAGIEQQKLSEAFASFALQSKDQTLPASEKRPDGIAAEALAAYAAFLGPATEEALADAAVVLESLPAVARNRLQSALADLAKPAAATAHRQHTRNLDAMYSADVGDREVPQAECITQIVVSGAGSEEVNGTYDLAPGDIQGGRPVYVHTENPEFKVQFSQVWGFWILDDTDGDAPYKAVGRSDLTVPVDAEWSVYQGGRGPPPVIRAVPGQEKTQTLQAQQQPALPQEALQPSVSVPVEASIAGCSDDEADAPDIVKVKDLVRELSTHIDNDADNKSVTTEGHQTEASTHIQVTMRVRNSQENAPIPTTGVVSALDRRLADLEKLAKEEASLRSSQVEQRQHEVQELNEKLDAQSRELAEVKARLQVFEANQVPEKAPEFTTHAPDFQEKLSNMGDALNNNAPIELVC